MATRSFLGYARVLAESWARVHRATPFSVLLLDGSDPDLDVVAPEDLGLDPTELDLLRGMYGPMELACALKPRIMSHLLDGGADAVVFLDSDTDVYAPLDDVGLAAAEHGVALSPHVLAPIPEDGCSLTESNVRTVGIFNAGLVAVGRSGRPFLDWWAAELARNCVREPDRGLWYEQRFLDRVPALFPHVVLRDSSLNVAYWNLHERPLTMNGTAYEICGAPLRHFHFGGFDPLRPGVLTTYEQGFDRPLRVRMERSLPLQKLCSDYAARVRSAGHDKVRHMDYPYARTAAGRRLGKWERAVFREAVLYAERTGGLTPPSPFDPEQTDRFEALIHAALDRSTLPLRVRARLEQLRARVGDQPGRPHTSAAGRAISRVSQTLLRLARRLWPALMKRLPTDPGPAAKANQAH